MEGTLNRIEVYRRNADGGLAVAEQLETSAGAVLKTPILPGLAVRLDQIFAR